MNTTGMKGACLVQVCVRAEVGGRAQWGGVSGPSFRVGRPRRARSCVLLPESSQPRKRSAARARG